MVDALDELAEQEMVFVLDIDVMMLQSQTFQKRYSEAWFDFKKIFLDDNNKHWEEIDIGKIEPKILVTGKDGGCFFPWYTQSGYGIVLRAIGLFWIYRGLQQLNLKRVRWQFVKMIEA